MGNPDKASNRLMAPVFVTVYQYCFVLDITNMLSSAKDIFIPNHQNT
jgi:hypothetical protein